MTVAEITEQSSHYEDKYGAWAGFPAGHKPNFALCCEEVSDNSTRWPRYHQCSKKRGHGPDGAYCKQHDPEVVKARRAASDARGQEAWNKRLIESYGKTFYDALVKIADGHNDARGLAQETVARFKDRS
jgi:hypothetical protein